LKKPTLTGRSNYIVNNIAEAKKETPSPSCHDSNKITILLDKIDLVASMMPHNIDCVDVKEQPSEYGNWIFSCLDELTLAVECAIDWCLLDLPA
jgi:hypothetical protein